MNKTLKNLLAIYSIIVTLIGVCLAVHASRVEKKANEQTEASKTIVAELTGQFDKQLEDVIEARKTIKEHEPKFVWSKPEEYEDWKIVNWHEEIVFGYHETYNGIEILIGTFDGDDYETSFIWDIKNPEIVYGSVNVDNIELSDPGQGSFLKFQWYGVTYFMNHDLKVWRIVEEG